MNYPKLPPAFKKKWVKALRSGKYKQGKGQLLKTVGAENRYCCLGVAMDCIGDVVDRGDMYIPFDSNVPGALHGDNSTPSFLSKRNDGANKKKSWKFPEIANWIEKHL